MFFEFSKSLLSLSSLFVFKSEDVFKILDMVEDILLVIVGIINFQVQLNSFLFGFSLFGFSEDIESGLGFGVIFKKENGKVYIIMNNYVVEGVFFLKVFLYDGIEVIVKLVGSDLLIDLVVF